MNKIIFIIFMLFSKLCISQFAIDTNKNALILTSQMKQYEIQKSIENNLSRSITDYNYSTPYVFNLKFYQLNSANGTNNLGYNFTVDDQIMDMVADLNTSFNRFNIFFKYRGFQILNTQLSDIGIARQSITNAFEDTYDPDGKEISVVFCNTPYASSYIPSDPQTVVNKLTHTLIFRMTDYQLTPIKNKTINKLFLGQNMGLLLGLFYINSTISSAANGFFGDCENVPRLVNYNWNVAGDYLQDTPATPQGLWGFGPFNGPYLSAPCTADVSIFQGDCSSPDRLQYINTLNDNFMDFTFPQSLITLYDCYSLNFTNDQGRRMRETIANPPPIYYGNFPINNSLTFVSSLYEPYAQDLLLSNNMPPRVTDNGDGTATVCKYYYYSNYKFQKGFDYIFPESTAPDLFSATVNQIPLVTIPMFNYPVTILQLASGQTNLSTNTGFVLNNDTTTICNVEPYNTGTKTFASQILSTTTTTESLNQSQLQDPNFYINLEGQKIYKIIKETNSGAKSEEVFFKQ